MCDIFLLKMNITSHTSPIYVINNNYNNVVRLIRVKSNKQCYIVYNNNLLH